MSTVLTADDPFEVSLPATIRWVEPVTQAIADDLLDAAALANGARVLDVGAGSGPLAVTAAQRGLQVNAIDTAPLLVNHVKGRLASLPEGKTKATAEVMDATDLLFPDATFDAAFSVFTVMFLGPGTPAALSELRRVIRPGGTLSVVHWAATDGSPVIRILAEAASDIGAPIDFPFEYLERDHLSDALSAAGFANVQVRPYSADYPFPAAQDVFLEYLSFYLKLPPFRALSPMQRAELEIAMTARAALVENGDRPRPLLLANIAQAEVPTPG